MPSGPGSTGWDGVRFSVHRDWNDKDVTVTDVWDCVKENVSFIT